MELRYYESSKQATLFSFRNVIENNDVRYLLILDDYSNLPEVSENIQTKLNDAWITITNEYSNLIDSGSTTLKFSEDKRIAAKRHKIVYIASLLEFISKYPDPDIIESLKADGFIIDLSTPELFEKTFKTAVSKINRESLQLKRSEPDQEETKEIVNFDLLITELEKFQGYQFNEQKTTVSKLGAIIKRYKDHGRQDK